MKFSHTQKKEPIVHNSTLLTSTSTVITVGILPSSSQQKGTHNSLQHLVNKHSSKCGILGSRLWRNKNYMLQVYQLQGVSPPPMLQQPLNKSSPVILHILLPAFWQFVCLPTYIILVLWHVLGCWLVEPDNSPSVT
jgi:hypothetical protein